MLAGRMGGAARRAVRAIGRLARRARGPAAAREQSTDDISAELTAHYWHAYTERMTTVKFADIARQFPGLVGQAVRLAWSASRADTVTVIVGYVASGVFSGYALFATTGVLEALFAAGPTPYRVREALPSLLLVALSTAIRSGLSTAGNWAQSRLGPLVDRTVEMRLYELATRVELAAYDDPDFHDHMQRAQVRGTTSATGVVNDVLNWLTGFSSMIAAAVVVGVLNPVLLLVLLIAQLPGAWSAVRSARIEYLTRFALVDAYRRQYILSWLATEQHVAAELRSFTMRSFLLSRLSRIMSYVRDAELAAARRQTATKVAASALGGVATVGVYAALGGLLALGALPLSVAGTAVLAIRAAGASLQQLMFSVNKCYEDGLYFTDYLAFCADAESRIRAPGPAEVPPDPERLEASAVSFTYPGGDKPALTDVTVSVRRGEVVALVGENGSGKTTLAKILAGLYQPSSGSVAWDGVSLDSVDGEKLRERIAVIAQDHTNWPLTVRENITMGRVLDPELLAAAAASSGADTVIDALAKKYDTLLARQFKDGVELSGGQWQRIAAARGFYRSAPLLIMDEPTAALDARAEYALFSSLRSLAEGRAVLIITHRLASVRHADRIYVLNGGGVAEQGTHAELMKLGGQYADLYTLQASQYEL
jgi:ATP-binding cassette subfamily B protein/ATP-binding cassette subfamily C protein